MDHPPVTGREAAAYLREFARWAGGLADHFDAMAGAPPDRPPDEYAERVVRYLRSAPATRRELTDQVRGPGPYQPSEERWATVERLAAEGVVTITKTPPGAEGGRPRTMVELTNPAPPRRP